MKGFTFLFAIFLCFGCERNKTSQELWSIGADHQSDQLIQKIAFGSCGHEDEPQPILAQAASKNPDLFIFLGDNIYGDTKNMDTLRHKYQLLGQKKSFQKLKATCPVIAIWDDHDYGWNDAGRHYPFKEESREIMLNFFEEPEGADRWDHSGIYTSYLLGPEGKKLQVILLDTRTFRDSLVAYNGNRDDDPRFDYNMGYSPNPEPDSTLLGAQQWAWLERQLQMPADIRLIGSSIQFGITHNGYEAWANVPHEQQKMLNLIKKTRANGVFFISGDVHYSEISKMKREDIYPLYDLTSSGITSTWDFATPNENRIAGPEMKNHFSMITIDWEQPDPEIKFETHTIEEKVSFSREVNLSEIRF